MNDKKIIFVHGDKGGTGKSLTSSVLVDYYLNNNRDLLVIEGDNTVPDVAKRFGNLINGVSAGLAGDDPADAVSRIIEYVEKENSSRIVVNLPASAGETLDPLAADLIQPAFAELEYEINVCFVIGKTSDSSDLAEKSLNFGLAGISDNKTGVINGFFGNVETFDWSNSKSRKNWLESGGNEVFLPSLHERVAREVLAGAFSDYLNTTQLTIPNKILLKNWLAAAHKIGDLIEQTAEPETDSEATEAA